LSTHIPSQWYMASSDEDKVLGRPTSLESSFLDSQKNIDHAEIEVPRAVQREAEYDPGSQREDQPRSNSTSTHAPPWFITKPHHRAEAVGVLVSWPIIQLVLHFTGVGAQFQVDEPRTWVRDLCLGWMGFLAVYGMLFLVSIALTVLERFEGVWTRV
jgi:hypothetical protein